MTSPLPPEQPQLPPPAWPPEPAVGPGSVEAAAESPSRARRYTLIGLSAGLIGGATVGLAATVPGLTQASEPIPQLAAVPDDTTDDTTDTGDDPAGETPSEGADVEVSVAQGDAGGWIRSALQPLVDDGTLTTDQLERVVAELIEARPALPRFEHHGPGDSGPGDRAHVVLDREELAAVLGIDVEALADELRAGTSLAEIAAEHGVDVAVVIDMLVADAEARLDHAVADGRLTDDESADRAATIRERVTDLVNREFALPPEPPALPDRPGMPDRPDAPESGVEESGDDTSDTSDTSDTTTATTVPA